MNQFKTLVMLAVMLIIHFDRGDRAAETTHQPSRRQLLCGHLLMVAAGFWGGFIQIGVGFILMPILNRVMGLDLVRTNMHKVFIIASYTVAALLIFATRVEIIWVAGLALALGNSLGGYLGAHFTVTRGERLVRTVLNLVLVAFIIKLLLSP